MKRGCFRHDGLTLSFLDAGQGSPLIALHAHWMEAATFERLAQDLAPHWRVIAFDQRGHGFSDHAPSYTREDYLGDISALLDHLGLKKVAILGNSLGGANAYQFAARFPARVSALIVEDIGAVIDDDTGFALPWAGLYPTRAELEARIGSRLVPALTPSVRETAAGWTLAFDPRDTVQSQHALNGNHWADWLGSTCPALLIGGRDSRVTDATHLSEMAARRPHTELAMLDGGHVVHFDNPDGFSKTVSGFLDGLSR